MTLPIIGISTYREEAAWGVWRQAADLLPAQYAIAIEYAGGVPLLLPPVAAADAAAAVIARLDGLVIAGGADVDPARYGAEPHERTAGWRPDRDGWELALLSAAYDAGLPVLGICRGMQLMAVHAGGTLEQHVPDRVAHTGHSPRGDAFGPTVVRVVPGSRLAALVGDEVAGSCHHHQGVVTHPGFIAVATAADGTLEAMEAPGEVFRVGVQWHPETAADAGLFAGFVGAAAANGRISP